MAEVYCLYCFDKTTTEQLRQLSCQHCICTGCYAYFASSLVAQCPVCQGSIIIEEFLKQSLSSSEGRQEVTNLLRNSVESHNAKLGKSQSVFEKATSLNGQTLEETQSSIDKAIQKLQALRDQWQESISEQNKTNEQSFRLFQTAETRTIQKLESSLGALESGSEIEPHLESEIQTALSARSQSFSASVYLQTKKRDPSNSSILELNKINKDSIID